MNRNLAEILPQLITRPIGGDDRVIAIHAADLADAPSLIVEAPDSAHLLTVDLIRAARDAFLEATDRYNDACARQAAANLPGERTAESARWEARCNQFNWVAIQAKDRLIEAILNANSRIEFAREIDDMGTDWTPCAFELDGIVYVVSQRADEEGHSDPVLTVLQATDVKADRMDTDD
jgi:hypothetical protein